MPNYPTGKVFPGYDLRTPVVEQIGRIRTARVPLYTAKTGFSKRLRSYLSFAASASRHGPRLCRRPELLFVESPPLFIGYAASDLSWRWKCPFVFNVSDLWPESAIRMGIVKPGLATRMAERLEHKLYRRAAGVTGQSAEIVAAVRRCVPAVRAEVITNGVDPSRVGPDRDGDAAARAMLGPEPGPIFIFAGLLGLAQGLDQILDLAASLNVEVPGRFVLVGEGPDRERLVSRIERERIGRIKIVPAQPRERIPALLAAADAALITLGMSIPGAVPSKIYEAMASRLPILLVADGEPATRIADADCGIAVAPGDFSGTEIGLRPIGRHRVRTSRLPRARPDVARRRDHLRSLEHCRKTRSVLVEFAFIRSPEFRAVNRSIACVVGARPNFVKMGPILAGLRAADPQLRVTLIHTGQHYDEAMSDLFFRQLGLPTPDVHLEVGSGSQGEQTAKVLSRYESWLMQTAPRPLATLVVGDVNSTMACTLASVKLGVPVIHVEAGLRSFDRTMPEEINRVVTDAISELLLVSEPSGIENLKREGRPEVAIRLVGNVMIDVLLAQLPAARALEQPAKMGLMPGQFAVWTMHRPSNVDDSEVLAALSAALGRIAGRLPVVFPVHPRTRARLEAAGLWQSLEQSPGVRLTTPLGYQEFLSLTSQARLIITDSGGLQEESAALEIPCLTLRENTERPITVSEGTSTLVGNNVALLEQSDDEILAGRYKRGKSPVLWDGKAGERIGAEVVRFLANRTHLSGRS